MEQELLTLPEHLSSSLIFSGVGVTPYLVICVFFVDRCLSFCTFCFGHCVVCSSSIYDSDYPFGIFELLLQIFLIKKKEQQKTNKNTTSEQYQNIINGDKMDTLNTHISSRLLSYIGTSMWSGNLELYTCTYHCCREFGVVILSYIHVHAIAVKSVES